MNLNNTIKPRQISREENKCMICYVAQINNILYMIKKQRDNLY